MDLGSPGLSVVAANVGAYRGTLTRGGPVWAAGSYAFEVNGCLPNRHLWVAHKEARGPDKWGNGPLAASSPDPLVAVTRMCGLLCMCSTSLGTPQRGQSRVVTSTNCSTSG
jgi:hypothetical protein